MRRVVSSPAERCADDPAVTITWKDALNAAVTYRFYADFVADDQSFSDTDVLGTSAGVVTGQLTVHDAGGSAASIDTNRLYFIGSSGAWGNMTLTSEDTGISPGNPLLLDIETSSLGLNTQGLIGFADGLGGGGANFLAGVYIANQDYSTYDGHPAPHGGFVSDFTGDTQYQFAIIPGGFDSNKKPMASSANRNSYAYGAWTFWKSGGNWLKGPAYHGDAIASHEKVEISINTWRGYVHKMVVPDVDHSSLLEPIVCDSFNDTNGTALTSHTPDKGPAWSELEGTWTIEDNQPQSGAVGNGDVAVMDSGVSDCIVCMGATTHTWGMVIRATDADNWWLVHEDGKLYENNAGVLTERLNLGTLTDERIVMAEANGSSIKVYENNNTTPLTYASATHNQTATKHGIRSYNNNAKVAHSFSVHYIGDNGEYNALDDYL